MKTMQNEVMVSVVVPVYQVEKYLEACINSIVEQTLSSREIILVDDGSRDNGPAICDEYCKKYDFIHVIHQKNQGLSAARNAGMSLAIGKYIAFCDSDDTMKPNMLSMLVDAAENHQCDVVICGFERFPNGSKVCPGWKLGEALTPQQLIASCSDIHSKTEMCFCPRMFFRSSFLKTKQLIFDTDIRYGEDFIFNMIAIMEASRIYVLPDPLYNYRTGNADSITAKKYKPGFNQMVELQYEKKKALTAKYGLNQNAAWTTDMAYFYATGFASALFRNAANAPKESRKREIREALNLPALTESFRACGPKINEAGKKYAVFCALCRWKITPVVMYLLKKWHNV